MEHIKYCIIMLVSFVTRRSVVNVLGGTYVVTDRFIFKIR
jgi:hypothetical protein